MNPLVVTLALAVAAPASAPEASEIQAVQAELSRGLDELKLPGQAVPYYASFRWLRGYSWVIDGSYGGAPTDALRTHAYGQVDIRVGSRVRDNGGFLGEMATPVVSLALTPDARTTRHRLWRAMDQAYRAALANYVGKDAAIKRLQNPQLPADRVGPPPAVVALSWAENGALRDAKPRAEDQPSPAERTAWHDLITDLSRRFAAHPEIDNGDVLLEAVDVDTSFVSSEGVVLGHREQRAVISVVADTQAADGMRLDHGDALFFRSLPDVSPELRHDLEAMVDRVIAELSAQVVAPRLAEAYDGPILFSPVAAAQVLATTVGTQAGGEPSPLSGYGRIIELEPDWLSQLDRVVMPDWLELFDDPGSSEFSGYELDALGYPAKPLQLVKRGKLVHLLMTEVPNRLRQGSHGRRRMTLNFTGGPSISHLQLRSRRPGRSQHSLESRLLRRAAEDGYDYAYVLEALRDATVVGNLPRDSARAGSSDTKVTMPIPARLWRIERGGQRTLVRGALLAPVSMRVLRRIREVGRQTQRVQLRLPPGMSGGVATELGVPGLLGQTVDVEVSAPALIIDGFELTRERGEQDRLPELDHPLRRADREIYLK